jgi:acylphosphatase
MSWSTIRLVRIRGKVQGIGYRIWSEREALKRGLEGWVRNRKDGSVEAVFAGTSTAVNSMIDICRKGPPLSRVDAVDVAEADAAELESRRPGEKFTLLPTL